MDLELFKKISLEVGVRQLLAEVSCTHGHTIKHELAVDARLDSGSFKVVDLPLVLVTDEAASVHQVEEHVLAVFALVHLQVVIGVREVLRVTKLHDLLPEAVDSLSDFVEV